jgi:hypothetical protein
MQLLQKSVEEGNAGAFNYSNMLSFKDKTSSADPSALHECLKMIIAYYVRTKGAHILPGDDAKHIVNRITRKRR